MQSCQLSSLEQTVKDLASATRAVSLKIVHRCTFSIPGFTMPHTMRRGGPSLKGREGVQVWKGQGQGNEKW